MHPITLRRWAEPNCAALIYTSRMRPLGSQCERVPGKGLLFIQSMRCLLNILTLLVNIARRRILNIEKRDHAWILHSFPLACIIVIHACWEKPERAIMTIMHATSAPPGEWARTASSRRHTQTYEKKPNSKHCKQLLFYLIYLDYNVDLHRSMKYLV